MADPSLHTTAPIGPKTVTVLGDHWPSGDLWDGFEWSRADLRSGSILDASDYHLGVPWMHPDDRKAAGGFVDEMAGIYRLRLKRGWQSFVQVGGAWMVSKAPRQAGNYGTPPAGQISMIVEINP